jgi:superfamily II DNA or RNA helicase
MGIVHSDYLENLREHFSAEDPAANMKRMRYGGYVSTRNYAITAAGRFKLGMLTEITDYINSLSIPTDITILAPLKGAFYCDYEIENLAKLKLDTRDYQKEAVTKALKQGSGVILSATASGKTLIIASLVETIRENSPKDHKTMIVVPGVQLVEQTYNDLVGYGVNPLIMSKWSGTNKYNPTSNIVITSINILQSKKTDTKILSNYDLFIADEVHKFRKGNKANELLKKVKTKHTYGFTGTMPEEKIDEWNIIGQFGPVLIEKTSNELRDEDYVSDARIQVVRIKYKNPLIYKTKSSIDDPTAKYNEECDFIYNNKYRNHVITSIAKKVDNNILILVDRIEQGLTLEDLMTRMVPEKTVYFIRGSVDIDDREKIRKIMEEEDNIICVAMSAIFSTGINIKNLHYILFASAGKAKIKIIQSIGRGLRLHENKKMLVIFDICDRLEYSIKHLVKRLTLYKKEKINYAIKEIVEKRIS